jgi:soluble lytic murein transglycosylase-like protein
MRPVIPMRLLIRMMPVAAALLLLGGSATLAADAPSPRSATLSAVEMDTLRLDLRPLVPRTRVLQLIREEARQLRDPELELFRYTQRYRVSPEIARAIVRAAEAEGIDPDLGFRLIRVESRFQPRARGPRGAVGLAQVMPSTARQLDPSIRSTADLYDPDVNLRLGFRYLRTMIDTFDGDVRLGLLAYNRGPGTVRRVLRNGGDPENGFTRRVLGSQEDRYAGPGLLTP